MQKIRGFFQGCKDKMKGIDQFSEGFQMRLEKGESKTYPSYFGAILSIIGVFVLFSFAVAKMETLLGIKDVDIIESFSDYAIE